MPAMPRWLLFDGMKQAARQPAGYRRRILAVLANVQRKTIFDYRCDALTASLGQHFMELLELLGAFTAQVLQVADSRRQFANAFELLLPRPVIPASNSAVARFRHSVDSSGDGAGRAGRSAFG